MPCQHCQIKQQLTTLKQQKKDLENIPPQQRHYAWRKDWNKNEQQILKKEQQLASLSKTPHECDNWEATTPRNSQAFTWDNLKNDSDNWEQAFKERQNEPIRNSLIVEDLVKQTCERERERERERESNFSLKSIIS